MGMCKTLFFFSSLTVCSSLVLKKTLNFPLYLKLKKSACHLSFLFFFLHLDTGHALCVTCSWPTETEAQPLFLLAQGWVPHVGGTTQQEVIPGSGIAKNILLAQEVVSDYHKEKGKARCTLKVDLIKAYDFLS